MRAVEIIEYFKSEQEVNNNTPFEDSFYSDAIEELNDLLIDKNKMQELFIKQSLKHKKEIKELKIKFIEDVSFLKNEN